MPRNGATLVALIGGCAVAQGHGVLARPVSRATRFLTNASDGVQFAGNCPGGEPCIWYTQSTTIPGNTTICDRRLRTMGVSCGDKNPSDYPCTPGAAVPWCAPGSAPVVSPCGVYAGGAAPVAHGRDMRDLPSQPQAVWRAGGVAEVMWAITANHGGGYAYRLCPADSELSEECFQRHHLSFNGATQWLVNTSGVVVGQKEAVRVSEGTWPRGSTWTQNPIPQEKGTIPQFPGLPDVHGRGPFSLSVKDEVRVPADLPAGNYVLSWRWDAEQTKQVWAHCSDVTIVSGRVPTAVPPVPAVRTALPPPPAVRAVCRGESLGLDVRDCAAWVDLYDTLGGDAWPRDWEAGCDLRLDPCGCGKSWKKSIVCSQLRNLHHITELYLLGGHIRGGSLPQSISSFSQLKALSLVDTAITGPLPDTFGDLPSLQFLWLDHNPSLGGALPASLTKLQGLLAFELHECNFTGALPPLNYRGIGDCHVDGNVFACPLPPGADTCGAMCA